MTQIQLPAPVVADKILELVGRIEGGNGNGSQDIQQLRGLLAELPEDPFPAFTASHDIQTGIIGQLSRGVRQVFVLAETDRLKRDLGYTASPPLEQLMIDNILTLRLRALHAEMLYNETVVDKPVTFAMGAYRDKLLTSTQNRYLKAIETLAKVRRLARHTPALQINIAREGGQQVNVQGEVSGQRVPQGLE